MDFNARFYSPALGRFIQPDSIIPDLTNSQAWNRYSYVLNNPIMYVDPSGHNPCMDDGYCGNPNDYSYQKHIYSNAIALRFSWNLEGNWKLDELKAIYKTGKDIESFVDGLSNGKGTEWMNEYLGEINIIISKKSRGRATRGKIKLPYWWITDNNPEQYFAHELAHIWDIETGHIGMIGAVKGPGDYLNSFINHQTKDNNFKGSSVLGSWACRFCDDSGIKHIPPDYQFSTRHYGNNSTADYLAEIFGWMIYDPSQIPNLEVRIWVEVYIVLQADYLP